MTADLLQVRTWGIRGSLPVSGPEFAEFGGNTTCFEVRCGDHVLLFDAGSGILPAGQALTADGVTRTNLFFTHCHYDHIIGLPYFSGLFDPASSVDIWSGHLWNKMSTAELMYDFMSPPWFPVAPDVCPARIRFHDFEPGATLAPEDGVTLLTRSLTHPGGAVGYRVNWRGRSVAIVTDTEHEPGKLDPAVMDLIDGVDLFFYDASYLEEEMANFRGFGHSSWQQAVLLARAAGARRVGMVHHTPTRTDADLRRMEAEAKAAFPAAFFAREGQVTLL